MTALALQEPPFFSGHDLSSDLDTLRGLLADGNRDEAMRYNLTSVIGLPPGMVEGMSHGPDWAAMVAIAPTLIYDLTMVNQINVRSGLARALGHDIGTGDCLLRRSVLPRLARGR